MQHEKVEISMNIFHDMQALGQGQIELALHLRAANLAWLLHSAAGIPLPCVDVLAGFRPGVWYCCVGQDIESLVVVMSKSVHE